LHLAAKHADVIKGAIPINAPVLISSPDLVGLALDPAMPEFIPGIGSDIKAPGSKELAYAQVPVAALKQTYVLVAVTRDLLPRIKCPTLAIQAREDHVVDPSNGPRIVRLIGANRVELLWLENSYHVAALDNDKGLIAERAVAFIKSIAGR
jgi:carboxylesterase